MEQIGALNLKLKREPYVYRIELLDRFFAMLDKKELVMVRPSCWSDPLENIIFNATLLKNGKRFNHPAKKNIYGQCWSYEEDSYALWQIYTTKTDDKGVAKRQLGVRVTTYIDRLKQISEQNGGKFYFGLVNYMTKTTLNDLAKNKEFVAGLKKVDLDESHLKTLLVKRKSYAYERELRLLAVPDARHIDRKNDALCRLKIDPTKFISSIRLDPTMEEGDVREVKELLVKKYGFAKTKISQSTLHKGNKFVFKLD